MSLTEIILLEILFIQWAKKNHIISYNKIE